VTADDYKVAAFLSVVLVTFIGAPLAFWFARKVWKAVEIAGRVEQALMGVEGGRGLVSQVEMLRVEGRNHANDLLALKIRMHDVDGKGW
jgi:hypothetical protein